MSIYNKIIELSIAIISLVSLVFNILFPNTALAKENIKTSILRFDLLDTRDYLHLDLVKDSNFPTGIIDIRNISSKEEEKPQIPMIPVEAEIEKTNQVNSKLVESESGDDNDKIAEDICKAAGIVDLPCWQDLKAMRQKESYDGKAMVGDSGRSRGWYHIQTKMHNVTVECALDFKCSTEWTVKNLIAHNYSTDRFYAISRHNGGGKKAQEYARSVIHNSEKSQ